MIKRQELLKRIRARDNFMPIDMFMSFCLHDQDYGYYRRGNPLARSGDFVTAPEISSLFGEMIALWILSSFLSGDNLKLPKQLQILELGPGTGKLMRDILKTLQTLASNMTVSISLMEINETLRDLQYQILTPFSHQVSHCDRLDTALGTLNPEIPSIILANEFFDALPTKQYTYHNKKITERGIITTQDDQLCFSPDQENALQECSPQREQAFRQLCLFLHQNAPTLHRVVIIDYGYARAHFGSSLQALRHGQKINLLESDLEGDLTTHVDFASLCQVSLAMKLATALTTQGHFLTTMGIYERARRAPKGKQIGNDYNIAQSIDRLVAPAQMGSLFKVLQLSNQNNDPSLISSIKLSQLRSMHDLEHNVFV